MNKYCIHKIATMAALFFTCAMTTFPSLAQGCKNYVKSGTQYIQVPVIEANLSGFTIPEFNPGAFSNGATIFTHNGSMAAEAYSTCYINGRLWYTGNPIYGSVNSLYGTYPTSMNGIGVRISIANTGQIFPMSTDVVFWSAGTTLYWSNSLNFKIELVKTGNITAAGQLGGEFLYYRVGQNGEILVKYKLPVIDVKPKVPTCSVENSYQNVYLEKINASEIGSPGSIPIKTKNFDIKLHCSGGDIGTSTRAYVTLTDANSISNVGKILAIKNTGLPPGEKPAEGVGLHIMKADNTILGFGPASSAAGNTNQWEAGTINQAPGTTEFTIPLKAGYVKTGLPIKAGKVYAQAIFTMSYQ